MLLEDRMSTQLEIKKAGSSYYAKLPGNFCIRVDYGGNHDLIDTIPSGTENVKPDAGDPPTPVLEKIKVANEVAAKMLNGNKISVPAKSKTFWGNLFSFMRKAP